MFNFAKAGATVRLHHVSLWLWVPGRRPLCSLARDDAAFFVTANNQLQMRQVMRERGDLLLAEGIGDISHRRLPAADALAGFVVVQRLDEVFLALARDACNGLGAGEGVGVTRCAAPPGGGLLALLR